MATNSLEFKLGSCKRKNGEMLQFLATLRKEKEYPVLEFESNLRALQDKMEKLLAVSQQSPLKDQSDGGCSLILDEFYPLLAGFDRQLQELKTKGTLMRFLTSNRLRRELEKSNTVLGDVFERFFTAILAANSSIQESGLGTRRNLVGERIRASSSFLAASMQPTAGGSPLRQQPASVDKKTSATSLAVPLPPSVPSGGSAVAAPAGAGGGTPLSPVARPTLMGAQVMSLVENEEARRFWLEAFGSEFQVSLPRFFNALSAYIKVPSIPQIEQRLLLHVIDNSNTGFVNVYKFSEFIKGFGPLKDSVENCKRIFCEPWFHGFLSGEEAVRLLEDQDVGTFLVRFSRSKPGSFALAFVEPNSSQVLQVEISAAEGGNGGFFVKEHNSERFFRSLHELLEYYKQYFVKPFSSELLSVSWFHGDLSYPEADDMLRRQEPGTFLVRFSKQPGCFAISFVTPDPPVKHALVHRGPEGFVESSSPHVFSTLTEFVEAHKDVFWRPYPDSTHGIIELVQRLREQGSNADADEQELAQLRASQEDANQHQRHHHPHLHPSSTTSAPPSSAAAGPTPASASAPAALASSASSLAPPAGAGIPTSASSPGSAISGSPGGSGSNITNATAARAVKYVGVEIILGDDGVEIKAGTIEKLVERMFLDAGVNDNTRTFLLTYRKYLTPAQLLQLITKAYTTAVAADEEANRGKVRRLRICNFLKHWIDKYSYDFDTTPNLNAPSSLASSSDQQQLVDSLLEFVSTQVKAHEGERLASQLLNLFEKQSRTHVTGRPLHTVSNNALPTNHFSPSPSSSASSSSAPAGTSAAAVAVSAADDAHRGPAHAYSSDLGLRASPHPGNPSAAGSATTSVRPQRPVISITKEPPVPLLPKTEVFTVGDIEALEVARQLTLIEYELYVAVQPKECLNMTWMKPELKNTHSPNIMRTIAHFNQVSMFVASAIVQETDFRKRVALVEHFIKIAACLRELNNFNGLLEIVSGMHHSSVDRLRRTFESISDKHKKILLDLKQLLSSDKSWAAYRETLRQTSTPLIPYLGVYLSDLVFIETGNSDWWDGSVGLVNFKKCRFIAKVISEITNYQQMPYNLWPVQSIRNMLLNLPILDDNKAHALSVQCEPRQQ